MKACLEHLSCLVPLSVHCLFRPDPPSKKVPGQWRGSEAMPCEMMMRMFYYEILGDGREEERRRRGDGMERDKRKEACLNACTDSSERGGAECENVW